MKAVTTVEMSKWEEIPLGKLVSFEKGRVVTTQGYETSGALPYIGAENFGGALTLYTTDPTAVLCEPTDVIMLWDGERSGLCSKGLKGAIGSTVVHLRPRNTIDVGYLYHQLARFFPWIQARRTGTGVPHVPKDLSSILWLPVPNDAKEQCRIAKALDTVDEAIANTEAVLAKLRQVRAGLLHDLLTRGLDENGELRDPIAHPEQFQDSPIGRIPRGWEMASMGSLLADVPYPMRSGPFGSALLKDELVDSGIPVLGIDNVYVEEFVRTYTRFVTEKKFNELLRYKVRPRDVMITIMGTVGRSCVVPDNIGDAISSKHVWTLTLDQRRYSPHLACWQFNYAPWVLRHFKKDEQGGVMSAIRSETLKTVLFPVPSKGEMIAIEGFLQDSASMIVIDETTKSKLSQMKSGLMSDLLTGRVRVPEDMELPK